MQFLCAATKKEYLLALLASSVRSARDGKCKQDSLWPHEESSNTG